MPEDPLGAEHHAGGLENGPVRRQEGAVEAALRAGRGLVHKERPRREKKITSWRKKPAKRASLDGK